jgi:hypothetical protein
MDRIRHGHQLAGSDRHNVSHRRRNVLASPSGEESAQNEAHDAQLGASGKVGTRRTSISGGQDGLLVLTAFCCKPDPKNTSRTFAILQSGFLLARRRCCSSSLFFCAWLCTSRSYLVSCRVLGLASRSSVNRPLGLMYNLFIAYPMSFAVERGWGTVESGLPLSMVMVGVVLGGILISCTVNTRLAPNLQEGKL